MHVTEVEITSALSADHNARKVVGIQKRFPDAECTEYDEETGRGYRVYVEFEYKVVGSRSTWMTCVRVRRAIKSSAGNMIEKNARDT
jgi:hypothetical protein